MRDNPPSGVLAREDSIPSRTGLLTPDEEIIFSRIVRATVGQVIEIPFRGNGWVYMGELASRRGLALSSRRNGPEGQAFIFRAEEAGTYVLKFHRQDFIRDYFLNDHVQVIIGEPPVPSGAGWFNPPIDRGRVVAQPRWPSALDEAVILRGGAPASPPYESSAPETPPEQTPRSSLPPDYAAVIPGQPSSSAQRTPSTQQQGTTPAQRATAAQTTPSSSPASGLPQSARGDLQAQGALPVQGALPAQGALPVQGAQAPQAAEDGPSVDTADERLLNIPPDELLQRAQESFNEGNVAAAITMLDRYRYYFPSGTDELYWLYGQFYEAATPNRNILLSLDYYRRLVNEYPQSRRFNDARRRIAYLERFYINIQ
jgi:hypothetical protein